MKKFINTVGLLALILGLGFVFAANGSLAAPDKIKIGVLYSITGKGSAVA
jgi:hypothetical protein